MYLITLYALRDDIEKIELVQRASLREGGSGLALEPALFASPEWWSLVESAEIPVNEIEGTISKVYWGAWATGPNSS